MFEELRECYIDSIYSALNNATHYLSRAQRKLDADIAAGKSQKQIIRDRQNVASHKCMKDRYEGMIAEIQASKGNAAK